MRYLTITADYTQSCLHDDFEGPITPASLGLPSDICTELELWNGRYRKVIPLDEEQRSEKGITELIARLDQEGLMLVEKVKQSIDEGAKVRYFSEGELRYFDP